MESKKQMVSFKFTPNMLCLIKKYAKKNKTTNTKIVEYALIEYFQKRNEKILF